MLRELAVRVFTIAAYTSYGIGIRGVFPTREALLCRSFGAVLVFLGITTPWTA